MSAADPRELEDRLRRELRDRGYRVTRYVYPPGTAFPEHHHDVDKIDAVLAGRFELVLEGTRHVLGPGQWVEVPAGARHTARVLGDEPVISLDAVRA